MQPQPHVRVGRVYDERTGQDGIRVLVDRLWPRGLTTNRADLDDWCKQIAPSAALRRWYGHDPDRFTEFARRYRLELDDPERAEHLQHLRELACRQTLTLLTATRHVDTSEAAVLANLLDAEARTGYGNPDGRRSAAPEGWDRGRRRRITRFAGRAALGDPGGVARGRGYTR